MSASLGLDAVVIVGEGKLSSFVLELHSSFVRMYDRFVASYLRGNHKSMPEREKRSVNKRLYYFAAKCVRSCCMRNASWNDREFPVSSEVESISRELRSMWRTSLEVFNRYAPGLARGSGPL